MLRSGLRKGPSALSRGAAGAWCQRGAAAKQLRTSLLSPSVSANNERKMLATYTMRAAVMSSHMHVTVLFSVKGAATVVVAPCSATLWSFVTNGSGVAPRYTNITTAVMLPVTRAASMAGGTIVVVFVSQLFCVVTVLTGVGCVQLTQVVSAWQRRAIQANQASYNLKTYMRTGTVVIRSTNVQNNQRANKANTFHGGPDAFSAAISTRFRKAY
ncbi:hypothetical protein DIPPA_09694 [Diplonema papillatum]|nr:hypothetical protein DIPPA_09694 [Diplonema papillatum]|eukprot:gene727-1108_t